VCGYNFQTKHQGSPPVQSQPKAKGRNGEGGTARDGVILVLEEASTQGEGLQLKDVNVRYATKYPDRVKGAKPESINSMISGILGQLVKEGLIEKDLESRTYALKKVVAKKPKKKSKTKAA
jgi:hypothetical protein